MLNIKNKKNLLTAKYSKFANALLYYRKILFMIIIVYGHNNSYLQMLFISVLNMVLIYYYLYFLPHESLLSNIINGISEFCLIIMQIAVCFLIEDKPNDDENKRINIGWIMVGASGVILFMHTSVLLVDLLRSLLGFFKRIFL